MMRTGSYRLSEREQAIVGLTRLGISEWDLRAILRDARTLARLAEAQCNGDWPADNGQRDSAYCGTAGSAGCGSGWHPSVLKGRDKLCPDCRASTRIVARLAPYAPQGIGVELAGDPRGFVVKVWGAGGREVGIA